jgi:transcriptional regulator with XRE-family HTH domain
MTNLQKLRKAAGLSQSQLARAAGVPVRTLQELEAGRKNINKSAVITVLRLADVLGCNIRDILEAE